MTYKSITKIVHMSAGTLPPKELAEQEYVLRLNGDATFRSGITIGNHEAFVVNYRDLALTHDHVRDMEVQVQQLWEELPLIARRSYLRELIRTEMMATNEIEGVHSTRQEIDSALEAASNDDSGKRFTEFAHLFLALAYDDEDEQLTMPTSLREIRDIYDQVIANEPLESPRPDGELFRKDAVFITDEANGKTIHSGVFPESTIMTLLTQWVSLTKDVSIPPLLRAMMGHFIFEYIHPFYDGNGRTGRLLLALELRDNLCIPTTLSLSSVIHQEKNKYYSVFDRADEPLNCMELSEFVHQMLIFTTHAQQHLLDDLREKQSQYLYSRGHMTNLEQYDLSPTQKDLLFALVQQELFGDASHQVTRKWLQQSLGIGQRKVQGIEELVQKGLVSRKGTRPIHYRLSSLAQSLLLMEPPQSR